MVLSSIYWGYTKTGHSLLTWRVSVSGQSNKRTGALRALSSTALFHCLLILTRTGVERNEPAEMDVS